MEAFESILHFFKSTLNVGSWACPSIYKQEYEQLSQHIGNPCVDWGEMTDVLIRVISEKFDIYHKFIQNFYDNCALYNVYFNYPEKLFISNSFIIRNKSALENILKKNNLSKKQIDGILSFSFYSDEEILELFYKEKETDNHLPDILESLLSSFIYNLYPEEIIHAYFSGKSNLDSNFYNFLRKSFPEKYNRTHALSILNVTDEFYNKYDSYQDFLSTLCIFVRKQYCLLQNHCYLGIIIEDIEDASMSIQWKLYSDITLYAEKHIEEELNIGYFHPQKIMELTSSYIQEIDVEAAKFNIANTGFTYKDCFIIANQNHSIAEREIYNSYKILLLFQKNERDEDIIPCPKCRSYNVRGNSYPILGVKSWECHNPLCADKSKYNRGKRYSLSQILKQEAIENPKNEIDGETIKKWRLDVVDYKDTNEIISYLVKEYTFDNDNVYIYGVENVPSIRHGRKIICKPFNEKPDLSVLDFYKSCYFKRFQIDKSSEYSITQNISPVPNHQVYNDDCFKILSSLNENSIDGAVTSPPYYNAREYSHWDNIYCYLYDMYNHAKSLFRVLKPGAYYLYNIFDYFDNENNVVFSAMGKKRMILGAYIINMFTRIGFEITQNTIWYKGQIQGNRATNQGNKSPYYQAPLNCYEHILCFRKPSATITKISFPKIINVFPVVKMVHGKNILGHTAPFPHEIPDLITARISGIVLDPYSGSFTTARSAVKHNIKSISIEKSENYCLLGIKLLKQEIEKWQLPLFDENTYNHNEEKSSCYVACEDCPNNDT